MVLAVCAVAPSLPQGWPSDSAAVPCYGFEREVAAFFIMLAVMVVLIVWQILWAYYVAKVSGHTHTLRHWPWEAAPLASRSWPSSVLHVCGRRATTRRRTGLPWWTW